MITASRSRAADADQGKMDDVASAPINCKQSNMLAYVAQGSRHEHKDGFDLHQENLELVGRPLELNSRFGSLNARRRALNTLVVLGDKYRFTQLELKRLEKKFGAIRFVNYKSVREILSELAPYVSSSNIKIVLNTKGKVDDDVIRHFKNLQFEKKIKYISMEHFLEKHLHKCYIPNSNDEQHFLGDIRPQSFRQYFLKRCVDISGLFCMLMLFLPVMCLCKKKTKAQSPGPVFYKQKRIGKNNKEFSCVKFRSMTLDAEKNGAQFACEKDPRIFPWGGMMRKTRLDELPQLINILKGEMHLIGPRPERKHWTEKFEKDIPYYSERHLVAPGITGWAQVMYPYDANEVDAKQKLMYDLYYIKYWSIALELRIVWMTVMVVMGKKGI